MKFINKDSIREQISPWSYYTSNFPEERIKRKTGWASIKCPFHEDRNPSLCINLDDGGFLCHSAKCAAKGGDIIAFEMRLHSLSFSQAIKNLANDWGVRK